MTIPMISPFSYRSIWLLFSASFVLPDDAGEHEIAH